VDATTEGALVPSLICRYGGFHRYLFGRGHKPIGGKPSFKSEKKQMRYVCPAPGVCTLEEEHIHQNGVVYWPDKLSVRVLLENGG
jgi:hypothetical protein